MVQIDEQDVEDLERLVFLGSYISRSGGNEEDIRGRPCCVQQAGQDLKGLSVSQRNKVNSYKSNALSLLLYGCETWSMIQAHVKKLNVLLHMSLHRILNIYWPMRITNEEIEIRAEIKAISKHVARRRCTWPGHVLRIA